MKMKIITVLSILSLFSITSCKKGCTDPYAKNYNSKKSKDNGSCEVYSQVNLHSIDLEKVPERNADGELWDFATTNDYDNDNSAPDIYVTYKAEGGYSFEPTTYYPSVDPNNIDKHSNITSPLSVSDWKDGKGFYVYFYEADLSGSFLNLMDSVFIDAFDFDASSNRFQDTMKIVQGEFEFTANMSWE